MVVNILLFFIFILQKKIFIFVIILMFLILSMNLVVISSFINNSNSLKSFLKIWTQNSNFRSILSKYLTVIKKKKKIIFSHFYQICICDFKNHVFKMYFLKLLYLKNTIVKTNYSKSFLNYGLFGSLGFGFRWLQHSISYYFGGRHRNKVYWFYWGGNIWFDHWLLSGEYFQLHEDQRTRSSSYSIDDFQVW